MDTIIILDAVQARSLLDALKQTDKSVNGGGIRSLRVSIDDGGAKFKINGMTWSPPLGRLDPDCLAAERAAAQQIRSSGELAAARWEASEAAMESIRMAGREAADRALDNL